MPRPKTRVSAPSPKENGSVSRFGSKRQTKTTTARKPDAKPSGMPIASRNSIPHKRISETVPMSIRAALPSLFAAR